MLILHVSIHCRVAQVGLLADLALEIATIRLVARSPLGDGDSIAGLLVIIMQVATKVGVIHFCFRFLKQALMQLNR